MKITVDSEHMTCTVTDQDDETAENAVRLAYYALLGIGFADSTIGAWMASLGDEICGLHDNPKEL